MGKIYFLSCLFSLFSVYQQGSKISDVRGFIHQEPVYMVPKEKALYTYDGSWKKIGNYPEKYDVILITDSFICYQSHGLNEDTLRYNFNNGGKEVFVRKGLNNVIVGTDGRTIFYDKANGENIQYKKGETVTNLRIKGYPMVMVGSHLYYYQYQSSADNSDELRAKIYDLDLDRQAPPVLVIKNAAGDRMKVSVDRKYMLTGYTTKPTGNDFLPVILDIKNHSVNYIHIDDDKLGTAYFSVKDSAFVFYGYKNMETQKLNPSTLKYIPISK